MNFYSTNNSQHLVTAREAVLRGLAPDGGLYMPTEIPSLPDFFFNELERLTFHQIAFQAARGFLNSEIRDADLEALIKRALFFEAPVKKIGDSIYVLELFLGPTLAFKDFAACFMAQLMSYFRRNEDRELNILVATSGDTGSAVASGFFKVPGIKVFILYPSGKVSPLQEKQLTTLGENVTALEIKGTFDDCQSLVKQAFVDRDLLSRFELSSANSINIARLIPQSFYYFHSVGQLRKMGINSAPVFSVPSGNFGNLTAGLFAKKMGLPVSRFVASTNLNDVFVKYLKTGEFTPQSSLHTLSNAMDVGNPSNFARIEALYGADPQAVATDVFGVSSSDEETVESIREFYSRYNYLLDPHGAVGYLGLKKYPKRELNQCGLILETAHPAKFIETMEEVLHFSPPLPESLAQVMSKQKSAELLVPNFSELKDYLIAKC